MADLTLTASSVKAPTGVALKIGWASAAFDAGMVVRRSTTGKWQKAQGDSSANAGEPGKVGFAVSSALAADTPFLYVESGDITTSGLTAGTSYYVSAATAGVLAPEADIDLANGYVTFVGIAKSATVLSVAMKATGAQH